MARFHKIVNVSTGQETLIQYTPEEEAAEDYISVEGLHLYNSSTRKELINGSASINVGSREIPVWIDSESRGSMTALVLAAQLNPTLSTVWKGSDGNFYTLTTSEIINLGLNAMGYVDTLFTVESTVAAKIVNSTITTTAQIDTEYSS